MDGEPTDVAADVQISKQRMNDLLRDLERLGYLWLEPDPRDQRARIIRLTSRGKAVHETAVGVHARLEQEWTALLVSRAVNPFWKSCDGV